MGITMSTYSVKYLTPTAGPETACRDAAPEPLSIIAEAIQAYALNLVAREAFQDFRDIVQLPLSTRLQEDLGIGAVSRGRMLARLRMDLASIAPLPLNARIRTIGDLVGTVAPRHAALH